MDELQHADFANLAIDSLAVGTGLGLAALLVDLFANLRSAEVVYVWSAQFGKELPSLRLLEEHSAASLEKSQYVVWQTRLEPVYLAYFL